jgi:hypothetical protein
VLHLITPPTRPPTKPYGERFDNELSEILSEDAPLIESILLLNDLILVQEGDHETILCHKSDKGQLHKFCLYILDQKLRSANFSIPIIPASKNSPLERWNTGFHINRRQYWNSIEAITQNINDRLPYLPFWRYCNAIVIIESKNESVAGEKALSAALAANDELIRCIFLGVSQPGWYEIVERNLHYLAHPGFEDILSRHPKFSGLAALICTYPYKAKPQKQTQTPRRNC